MIKISRRNLPRRSVSVPRLSARGIQIADILLTRQATLSAGMGSQNIAAQSSRDPTRPSLPVSTFPPVSAGCTYFLLGRRLPHARVGAKNVTAGLPQEGVMNFTRVISACDQARSLSRGLCRLKQVSSWC